MSAGSRGRVVADDKSHQSIGDLLGDVTRDMSMLVRQEVQLAKAEVRQEAKTAGKAAGMFAGAALAGVMVLLFLSYAAWWGLANVIDEGWAALAVAIVWAVAAAVLFVVARSRLRQVRPGIPRTVETARQIPGAALGRPTGTDHRTDGDGRRPESKEWR